MATHDVTDEYPQELLLATDLFPGVIDGSKTCTIRTKHRPIHKGCMRIRSNDNSIVLLMRERSNDGSTGWASFRFVIVRVTEVRHTTLGETSRRDLEAEGMKSWKFLWLTPLMRRSFLKDMRRFYPDVTLKSDVTVIHFRFSGDAGDAPA